MLTFNTEPHNCERFSVNKKLYEYLVAGACKSVGGEPLSDEAEKGDKMISLIVDFIKVARAECTELDCGCQRKCIKIIERELGVKKGTLSEKGKLRTFIDVVRRKIQNFRLKRNSNVNESGLYYNETRN